MYKQTVSLFVLIGLSAAVVVFMPQSKSALDALLSAHAWVSQLLTEVFSGGNAGNIARGLVALIAIPFIVGLIPALIFWLIRKSWMSCFMEIVWVVWLLQAGALIATFSGGSVA